jgi:hypothetical protein
MPRTPADSQPRLDPRQPRSNAVLQNLLRPVMHPVQRDRPAAASGSTEVQTHPPPTHPLAVPHR